MDIRNQWLWRKDEEEQNSDPGRPVVTWFLYPFYLICFLWFANLQPGCSVYQGWYPPPVGERLSLHEQRVQIQKEKAELEEARIKHIEAQIRFEQERQEFQRQIEQALKEAQEVPGDSIPQGVQASQQDTTEAPSEQTTELDSATVDDSLETKGRGRPWWHFVLGALILWVVASVFFYVDHSRNYPYSDDIGKAIGEGCGTVFIVGIVIALIYFIIWIF